MGIVKISQLPAGSGVTSDDLLVIVDDPSGVSTTKRITVGQINSFVNVVTATFSGSAPSYLETNASLGDVFDATLTDTTIISNPVSGVNGQSIRWRLTQDGTGNRSVTLGNKFVTPSSSTPISFSTGSGVTDLLAATYHAGRDKWDIVAFIPGY